MINKSRENEIIKIEKITAKKLKNDFIFGSLKYKFKRKPFFKKFLY